MTLLQGPMAPPPDAVRFARGAKSAGYALAESVKAPPRIADFPLLP